MSEEKKWYALYTRPRWEKKVNDLLTRKGMEAYCPLNRVRRRWTDRTKIVQVPLFTSYVFVNITEEEKGEVRFTDGVVNFVCWERKPAIIRNEEIELIKKFLRDYEDVEVRPLSLTEGQRVRIRTGVMMNKEGVVVQIKNNRAVVVIESLGYELAAQFEKRNLEPV
ncbi:MAG: UpxY family transcription antiterminator [Bacteroidetes bacterium]|nr:UpxY family transcription antiterminator [Bacteroidota bacterium]